MCRRLLLLNCCVGRGRFPAHVAQELETVLPDMVYDFDGVHKGVDYVELIPVLIKAVQELKGEIAKLKEST